MHDLLEFPVEDPPRIAMLREAAERSPDDDATQIEYGFALVRAHCGYQAARVLRLRRKLWKDDASAAEALAALDAQSWWNKNWKLFAQASQQGKDDEALELLGDRHRQLWDYPPLLMHLSRFAIARTEYDLAENIARRIYLLSQQGVPKINMVAFEYGSQEDLIEILWRRGDPKSALEQHRKLEHNPGNAMAFEIRRAELLVAAGFPDDAMLQVAAILRTARKERKGYSREMRLDFVDNAPELSLLRKRDDWATMHRDPAAWLKVS